MTYNELYHFGVLGMKWGVRKDRSGGSSSGSSRKGGAFKSKKQTLTDQEKRETIKNKKVDKQYFDTVKKPKYDAAQTFANEGSKSLNAIRNTRNQLKSKPKGDIGDLSKMSDADLKKKINRMNLEEQYTRLMDNKAQRNAGKDYVDSALSVAGTALTVTGSVVAIALGIKQLKGG